MKTYYALLFLLSFHVTKAAAPAELKEFKAALADHKGREGIELALLSGLFGDGELRLHELPYNDDLPALVTKHTRLSKVPLYVDSDGLFTSASINNDQLHVQVIWNKDEYKDPTPIPALNQDIARITAAKQLTPMQDGRTMEYSDLEGNPTVRYTKYFKTGSTTTLRLDLSHATFKRHMQNHFKWLLLGASKQEKDKLKRRMKILS